MFLSFISPRPISLAPGFALEPRGAPARVTPRGEHARLLAIAAARRLRAVDRLRSRRLEDAEYWIACAPVAVAKAAATRAEFAPLP